ncbi:MAG: phosphomannomutase [Devosia sp.]
MSSSLKFGTSGLRGLAAELAGIEARRYAAAFVRYAATDVPLQVLVGRDLRDSSPQIATDVMAAVTALGFKAVDCGLLPTPALALEAMREACPAIMVTGSHIPGDRNGLKFYRYTGEIDKADEAGILRHLGDAPSEPVAAAVDPRALQRYRDRCLRFLPKRALTGWRVGVWQHSSVLRDLLGEVLAAYGAEVVPLGRSDVFIAVDTEAVSAVAQAELAGWVRAHRLDALVSADGDGDRPLLVDEHGAFVRGDMIGILAAQFLHAGTVVTPVTSNSAIDSMSGFNRVVRTRVGSPYVIAAMMQASTAGEGTVVGFEANGGVLLGNDVDLNGSIVEALPTRDAMLPILAVLGAARAAAMTVGELVATLPAREARSDRLEDVPAEASARLIEMLTSYADEFLAPQGTIASHSDIDGPRFVLASGDVIHYRPSGNAPELRCYTEASTAARANELLAWGLAAAAAVVR